MNPWLVDFDLRKLHDLCCNFGIGTPDMFYAGSFPPQDTPEHRDATVDRFLAATVAFGHPGFLVFDGGVKHALRSYYMLQQLHSRYCLSRHHRDPLRRRHGPAARHLGSRRLGGVQAVAGRDPLRRRHRDRRQRPPDRATEDDRVRPRHQPAAQRLRWLDRRS